MRYFLLLFLLMITFLSWGKNSMRFSQPLKPDTVVTNVLADFTYSGLNGTQNDSFCRLTALTFSPLHPQTATATYTWSFGDNATANNANPVHLYTQTGTFTITLIITDTASIAIESDTAQLSVTIVSLNAPIFTMPASACISSNTLIEATKNFTPSTHTLWDIGVGKGIPQDTFPFYLRWDTTGTFAVSLTVSNGICPDLSSSKSILIHPNPIVDAGADRDVCEGDSAIVLDASIVQGVGPFTYSWLAIGGETEQIRDVKSEDAIFTPDFTNVFQINITDAFGCKNSDNMSVVVHPLPPVYIMPSYKEVCVDESVKLYANGALTYQWTPASTLLFTTDTSLTAISYPIDNEWYEITGTDIWGCQRKAYANIVVLKTPQTVINNDIEEECSCENKPITLTATSDWGTNYFWSNGETQPSFTFTPTAPGFISCVAYNKQCPGIPDSIYVVPIQEKCPIAQFVAEPASGWSPMMVQFQNTSQYAYTYSWTFNNQPTDFYNYSTQVNPNVPFQEFGVYEVMLVAYSYGSLACTDTAYGRITADSVSLFAPNAFSPNDDKHNDTYLVKFYGIKTLQIAIYDRWGTQVFASDNPAFEWDGKYKGVSVPEGVYIYRVEAVGEDNIQYLKEGTITLIR